MARKSVMVSDKSKLLIGNIKVMEGLSSEEEVIERLLIRYAMSDDMTKDMVRLVKYIRDEM